ncbi:hypothetical protein EO95_16555 [Methanosarcina sp. 1.H.T.1A.1]|uniref:caspase family protein n=1 Tax=Methanosarcina sp. 1.H.T.1A.1 TaxID=1483602 RepID=UPI000621C0BB|nr:caspase family protein [Methanosarcina sp. 1.H.T.1A.1]KKH97277.1 hypothetical protein EO95_16555 [Methanosarcina sp. 1.H.T.1A.1]
MVGKRLSLVIGNNYPNSDKELKFAVADATKMKEILENKNICDFDDVILLIDKTSKEASIELETLFTNTHQEDLIFIYFSGHGKKDYRNNLYLIFKDTNEKLMKTSTVPFDFISDCLKYPQVEKASVVIVLDCCYSAGAGAKDTDIEEKLASYSSRGTVILTSTGSAGAPTAMEDNELGHSFFTYYLIEGLEKGYADKDKDGLISIDELYNYAFEKTTESCSQSPAKKGSIEGNIFIGRNLQLIRENEYESKKEKLIEEFSAQLPPIILSESQTILRKYYETSSPLESVDATIFDNLESLLNGEILVENYIETVQQLKRIDLDKCRSKQKEEDKEKKEKQDREKKQKDEISRQIEEERQKKENEALEIKQREDQERRKKEQERKQQEELCRGSEDQERTKREKKVLERKKEKEAIWILILKSNKQKLVTGMFLFFVLFGMLTMVYWNNNNSVASAKPAPEIEWQKLLGGSGDDFAVGAQQISDGSYIVVGQSNSTDGDVTGNHGKDDYWVVKLDTERNIEWQKCLGGSDKDGARDIQQTSDGGYIVTGSSYSTDGDVTGNHGKDDYWVVKLDPKGNIDWQKCLGGSGYDFAYSIQQTSDGGYIVAGHSDSKDGDVTENHGKDDYWVVKLDTKGNIDWQKCLGGSGYDFAYSIQQTSDGGYIVAGHSDSKDGDVAGNHGINDYWVVKLDTKGNIDWQKGLGGSISDCAYSVQQTSDGGYIVAGMSDSNDGDVNENHGSSDCWVVKLDTEGNIEWQKCLGGSGGDGALSVQQNFDGSYIVVGWSDSKDGNVTGNHGKSDDLIVELDTSGNVIWQKYLGGNSSEVPLSIQQISDSGYIVVGYSNSKDGNITGNHGKKDYWVVKLKGGGSST